MITCRQCSTEFAAKRADATFCSDACRIKYKRIHPEGQPVHAVRCAKDTLGAQWRSVNSHKDGGYYVIPGRHMFSDIETCCLDPEHINMKAPV